MQRTVDPSCEEAVEEAKRILGDDAGAGGGHIGDRRVL